MNNFNELLGVECRKWRIAHSYSLLYIADNVVNQSFLSLFETGKRGISVNNFLETYVKNGFELGKVVEIWQACKK